MKPSLFDLSTSVTLDFLMGADDGGAPRQKRQSLIASLPFTVCRYKAFLCVKDKHTHMLFKNSISTLFSLNDKEVR